MKRVFLEEKIPLIIIFSLFLITYILMWGHCGDLILDCGREAYIPSAIASGKVLYKDIFCIYGAFPYLFNAFFFKIFGSNLSILYLIGGALAALYILGVYLCSREFLSKSVSAAVTLIVLFAAVFDNTIFNFIFPYSYAMVFASVFSIWILYLLIRFIHTKDIKLMHTIALLYGGICVSKIDFIPVIIPVLIVFFLFEKNKNRELIRFVLYSLFLPLITYLILFLQGAALESFSKNAHFVSQMLKSESLRTFYSNYSLIIFSARGFFTDLINLISSVFICTIFFTVTLYALRKRKKIIKYVLSIFIFLFCFGILSIQQTPPQKLFSLLPYICFAIFIWRLIKYLRSKDYKNVRNLSVLTLFAFALLCSLKNFHSLTLSFYGAYSFAPLLIAFVWFIKDLLENNLLYNTKLQYETVLCIFLSVIALTYLNNLIIGAVYENTKITTSFGMQKSTKTVGEPFLELVRYLEQNAKNKSAVVFPEGIMVNFLTGSKWDFYQTSFIPLDFDTFKEQNITKDFNHKKPDHVIFFTRDTREYGKSMICNDYGLKLCADIFKNYNFEAVFGDKFRIYLFARQNTKTRETNEQK